MWDFRERLHGQAKLHGVCWIWLVPWVRGSPSFHSDALKDGKEIKWPDAVYPDLHMPFAPSWSLHWAYRDGHLVNLPVSLLVEGDIIALRPGQESFASLRGIKVAQDFSFPGNAAGESTGSSGRAPV